MSKKKYNDYRPEIVGMEELKAFALREARRRFPAVEIPEKG